MEKKKPRGRKKITNIPNTYHSDAYAGQVKKGEDTMDALIEALIKHNFSVKKACEEVGVLTQTYYWHLQKPDFKRRLQMTKDVVKGIVSNALLAGLVDDSIHIRHKYLALLPQKKLSESLGLEEDTDGNGTGMSKGDTLIITIE